MVEPRITTNQSLTVMLFAEIVVDKDDEAMEFFRGSSIDTYGALNLRAKEYMMSEQCYDKDKLSIKFIIDENWHGRIGLTCSGPGGADRFYGMFQCVTVTHRKS